MLAHNFAVSCREAVLRLQGLRSTSGRACLDLPYPKRFWHQCVKAAGRFVDLGEHGRQQYWDSAVRSRVAHLVIKAHRCEEISCGPLLEPRGTIRISGDSLPDLAEAVCDKETGCGRTLSVIFVMDATVLVNAVQPFPKCECGVAATGSVWTENSLDMSAGWHIMSV